MLDNLRGMAVFASVVRHGSFSGAAKELGITTSAVSQQIRSLENDLSVTLLHRSTRKLSLTEAGESLYNAALQMVKAAEQGRDSVIQLKDEVSGSLRIAASAELAQEYLVPALSDWLAEHENLSLNIISRDNLDMIEDRIDVALALSESAQGTTLKTIKQILVASPKYLSEHGTVDSPKTLASHNMILCSEKPTENIDFKDGSGKQSVRVNARLVTNNQNIALNLAERGYGIVKTNEIHAKALLEAGKLVQILPNHSLPELNLVALTGSKEQVPVKAQKCLEVLQAYFKA
ncbi:transcriptional regulator, LysR family [Moraxella cuniculi DSM 21768]|uniref:Transcriptional regulator, LysR family n=1 Tax=Moraxella cuniculi DSM 21768 TaxID=1122245 RepID=A0A1N7EP67_9GAMM|nr:LysR family transcriptional regulator [Moraxella cuniculi]OOS07707.1 LysR family transcriptional regulator [Moraxella cuniculi]SIR89854.1 transcriptional regulator, LysR family [Moraxella cuniculi DSM 21768]